MNPSIEETLRGLFTGRPADLRPSVETYLPVDVVYREDPRWPGSGEFHGHEALIRRFQEYQELLEVDAIDVGDIEVSGEVAFWTVRVRARGAGSDAPMNHLWGYVGKMREGRFVDVQAYFDPDEARAAAGLAT